MPRVLLALAVLAATVHAQSLDDALRRAGDNRPELERALKSAPQAHRGDLEHLIRHMPAADLKTLGADFLLENVRLAHEARAAVPWGSAIPDDVFKDSVLPYANIDEPRDPWRAEFMNRFLDVVKDCKTPGEAAQKLNATVFRELGVKYSTKRMRANQSPKESIEQGLASCTGLSILLADACRACSVPARLAGVASWKMKRGNHTWVEVWDDGWHYTGAAEPNEHGLNRVWFQGDVSHAVPGSLRYGVWAVSWNRTGTHFPIVWSPDQEDVFAVDVTQRYIPEEKKAPSGCRLLVRVKDRAGERIVADVRAVRVGTTDVVAGRSRGPTADMNDILPLTLPKDGGSWCVYAELDGRRAMRTWRAGAAEEETIDLVLPDEEAILPGKVNAVLGDWFERAFVAISKGEPLPEERDLSHLLGSANTEAAVRVLAWDTYRSSPLTRGMRADFEAKRVRSGKHESPYTVKEVGKRPEAGWPLVIAMHGGGGVPKRINDSQWRHMQIYYRDHPDAGGYKYVALRAPNDSWNGFYTDYVYPLIERLITQFTLFGDVDPQRVHCIGYSHGGYGVFSIAPKIGERFAAAHASAAAPTDGQSSPRPLRNLPFSFMVGEKDTAYGRASRCQAFEKRLAALRAADRSGWPAVFQWQPGHGHGGLPDRDHLPRLLLHRRDPAPTTLDWELTDGQVRHHYWLSTEEPGGRRSVRASVDGNRITLDEAPGLTHLEARLDARLVDFAKPVLVARGEKVVAHDVKPSLAVLARTMHERGDPHLAATAVLQLIRR